MEIDTIPKNFGVYICVHFFAYMYSKPELTLEDPQGITSDQVKELLEKINQVAEGMTGEVINKCICNYVMALNDAYIVYVTMYCSGLHSFTSH